MLDVRADMDAAIEVGFDRASHAPELVDIAGTRAHYLVDCISDAESFETFRRPLLDLAEHALEPAVGGGFAWVMAGLRHLDMAELGGRVLLIWRHCESDPKDVLQLVGAFPITFRQTVPGLPLKQASVWNHYFQFSGVPLVHEAHHQSTLKAYLDWVLGGRMASAGLLLERLPSSGPFADTLDRALQAGGHPVRVLEPHERAVWPVADSVEDYLTDSLPRKKRKEFRRLRARLAEQGELKFEAFAADDDLASWLRAFYDLEGRGWKGQAGTSLASDPAWTGFFDDAFSDLSESGNALLWKLTLDGSPIAMILGARSARRAWLFKIAYDEEFAKYSPGVLIVLDVMHALSESGGIDLVDSCAQADHPMINHLWRERMDLHHLLIGPAAGSGLAFNSLYWLTRLKRDGRAAVKHIYKTWLKGGSK